AGAVRRGRALARGRRARASRSRRIGAGALRAVCDSVHMYDAYARPASFHRPGQTAPNDGTTRPGEWVGAARGARSARDRRAWVRALREAAGLSLRELADRSGVSAPMLSQVERGETSPTLTVAARVAAGLELRLSQLLRLDEDGAVTVVRSSGRRRGGNARRG